MQKNLALIYGLVVYGKKLVFNIELFSIRISRPITSQVVKSIFDTLVTINKECSKSC